MSINLINKYLDHKMDKAMKSTNSLDYSDPYEIDYQGARQFFGGEVWVKLPDGEYKGLEVLVDEWELFQKQYEDMFGEKLKEEK